MPIYKGKYKKHKWTDDKLEELADKLLDWMKIPGNFWIGDFAVDNLVSRSRLVEFAERNEYFRDIYSIAKQMQENKIFKEAFLKKADTYMAYAALKNVSGWRDKSQEESLDDNTSLKSVLDKLTSIFKDTNDNHRSKKKKER